jgi:DNA-binding transcriptional MerR regulator
MYTIKELADMAGVTTRTLRYYDQLGLLVPAEIGQNGYRYYDHKNLLRLQQILFFKELDVPLRDIKEMLCRPDFQLQKILNSHQRALKTQLRRIEKLLETIEKTISSLEGDGTMSDKEYFEGFDETRYEEEAQAMGGENHNSGNPSKGGLAILLRRKQRSNSRETG